MTLIVGKIIEGEAYIESDSRLTRVDTGEVFDPFEGVIKTVIIHPRVCISFAGNVAHAREALDRLVILHHENIVHVRRVLEDCSTRMEGGDTDFALATSFNNQPRFFVIRQGQTTEVDSFMLGEGGDRFQQEFDLLEPCELSASERMEKAFSAVIADTSIPSVGDFHITTMTSVQRGFSDWYGCPARVFTYAPMRMSFARNTPVTIRHETPGEWLPLPLGGPNDSELHVSLITADASRYGIAFHYYCARFGVFFCPQISLIDAHIIRDVDAVEFTNAVFARWGVVLEGLVRAEGAEYFEFVRGGAPVDDST